MKTSEIFKAIYPFIGLDNKQSCFLCIAAAYALDASAISKSEYKVAKDLIEKSLNYSKTLEFWAAEYMKTDLFDVSALHAAVWRREWCKNIIAENAIRGD